MPIYNLKRMSDDTSVEMALSIAELDKSRRKDGTFLIKGEKYKWDVQAHVEANSYRKDPASNWPQYSDAFSVMSEDAKEHAEHARAHGVPTDFVVEQGIARPKFEDREHRRRFYDYKGFFDRNGGYGDA
jgi:uncharacterized membrane-anchored protein